MGIGDEYCSFVFPRTRCVCEGDGIVSRRDKARLNETGDPREEREDENTPYDTGGYDKVSQLCDDQEYSYNDRSEEQIVKDTGDAVDDRVEHWSNTVFIVSPTQEGEDIDEWKNECRNDNTIAGVCIEPHTRAKYFCNKKSNAKYEEYCQSDEGYS